MIKKVGIGIDVVEIKRFKKIPYESKPGFYKRIFNPSEINYCLKFKDSYKHFAGKFAVKEAVKKSIPDKIEFLDIQTTYSSSKPIVKLKGSKNYLFLASISHENNIAIAVVISQRIH